MESLQHITGYLPSRLKNAVLNMPEEIKNSTDEIRLRKNGAFSVFCGGKNLFPDTNGKMKRLEQGLTVTDSELEECVFLLCKGSMYSYDDTVMRGFIPIPYGRAGVCGKTVTENGCLKKVKEITSVSLRVHRPAENYARKLIRIYRQYGILSTIIFSPPAMGKTTLLRSAAEMLGKGIGFRPVKVGIADERNEILLPDTDMGLCDTVAGCPKHISAELLTRTMSPEVIICDEITREDTEALLQSIGTGVCLICSCHAENRQSLFKKKHIQDLIEYGGFGLLAEVYRRDGIYDYTTEVL